MTFNTFEKIFSMKRTLLALPVIIASMLSSCGSNNPATGSEASDVVADRAPNTRIEILDPEGEALIDTSSIVENLGGGFSWTEGPLYIKDGDYVLFSDIPANKVMKWKRGEGISTYLHPAGFSAKGMPVPENEPGSNGLILDRDGKLVLCQHGDRRMARMKAPLDKPQPEYETIADRYQGNRLNSPNDAVYRNNGDLYFTDPPYGLDKRNDDTAMELSFHGVYRVKPDGTVDLVTNEFNYPNGIAFTPDYNSLLVAHSDGDNPVWMKYELDTNGLIAKKSVFYKIRGNGRNLPGSPDGMKMHSKGYLFASGPGGIWIFNSAAKPIARIYTGQATSNCAFSDDEKTLYMTCDDFFYRVKLK
jgi:gluconolactonase